MSTRYRPVPPTYRPRSPHSFRALVFAIRHARRHHDTAHRDDVYAAIEYAVELLENRGGPK